jgi:methylmalonyl-CoA mutase N-terminal domain/subunit
MGGAVRAIEEGFQKGEIENSAYDVALSIESGERIIVGQNRFAIESEEHYDPLRVYPAIGAQQSERLATLRATRSSADVAAALDDLRRAAAGTDNVLPPLKAALVARATVGEVSDVLREVWGTYTPADAF